MNRLPQKARLARAGLFVGAGYAGHVVGAGYAGLFVGAGYAGDWVPPTSPGITEYIAASTGVPFNNSLLRNIPSNLPPIRSAVFRLATLSCAATISNRDTPAVSKANRAARRPE